MPELLRRFRGFGIALAVLAISAGAVFAAAPSFSPTAAPQTPAAEEPSGDDQDDRDDEDGEEGAAPKAPKAPDADEDADDPAGTHGAIVSSAAKAETPEGFRNHGQFVSCVARMDIEDPATFDLGTVTPEACGVTPDEAKATGKEKSADKKAEGKAKSEAAKAKAAAKQAERSGGRP